MQQRRQRLRKLLLPLLLQALQHWRQLGGSHCFLKEG